MKLEDRLASRPLCTPGIQSWQPPQLWGRWAQRSGLSHHYSLPPSSAPTTHRGEGSCGCFSKGLGFPGDTTKSQQAPLSLLWLPLGLYPRQLWPWPPRESSQRTLASCLAETAVAESHNLLFLVPTLGRRPFGEGNCKLAFVVKPPAPGMAVGPVEPDSPRLPISGLPVPVLVGG